MNLRDRRRGWIGIVGGFVAAIVLNVAPLDDLLPINRILFALICGLMITWGLASAIPSGGDKL